MRAFRLFAAAVVAIASVAAVSAPADVTPHRFIVQFDGDLPADLGARLTALGITDAVAFETIDAVAVTAPDTVVERLVATDPQVVAARAERRLELHLATSVPYMHADQATVGVPADFAAGGASGTRPAVDGSGQYVAILDTGIFDLHPDLYDQVAKHLNFELGYAADLVLTSEDLDTYAEATGASARSDDIGHGTHVAGIVAGTGEHSNDRANKNRGVAPGAKLVDLRIAAGPIQGLVEDTGWERNAIAAFDWLIRHHDDDLFGTHGIRVNTNSWGLTGTDLVFGAPEYDPLARIIELVDGENIVTVFSAGNDGPEDDVTDQTVPNGLPQVISVAASCKPGAVQENCDRDPEVNDIAAFSSRGPAVDVAAPGVEIVSTVGASLVGALAKECPNEVYDEGLPCLYRGDYSTTGGSGADPQNYALYGSLHGTSMAAPHVAGAVALLLHANPDLTTRQVQIILAASARDRQAPGRDIEAGWGLVDVEQALIMATRLGRGESVADVAPGFVWSPSMLDLAENAQDQGSRAVARLPSCVPARRDAHGTIGDANVTLDPEHLPRRGARSRWLE